MYNENTVELSMLFQYAHHLSPFSSCEILTRPFSIGYAFSWKRGLLHSH